MKTRMKQFVGLVVGAAVIGSQGLRSAQAQGPAIANPISNWSYLNHSSTAAEGYLRGQASVASSAGEYNYLTSVAAVNRQEAIRRAIENSRLYVKTYFEKKEMRQEYLEKYGPRPLSAEASKRIQESYMPARLTETQYDRQSNRLYWPHILRQPQFDSLRDRVDDLFATRTPEDSGDGSPNERKIDSVLDALSAQITADVEHMTAAQFISAKDFVRSVAYESKQIAVARPAVEVKAETVAEIKPESVPAKVEVVE